MLKALLQEVGRSLRRNTQQPLNDDASQSTLKDQFQSATLARRAELVERLSAQLAGQADDGTNWTLLGDWLLSLGRFTESEPAYRRALQIRPLHARTQEGLGLVLLRLGRLEEAYLHLETASKLEPTNPEILIHWGLVDLELGNLGKAGSKFERAIERDPRNPHAWHNLALVALKQGDVPRSIEHFLRAIELKPDHGLAYSNLALALQRAERLDEALAAAARAIELKAGNARVFVVLGDLLINAGRFAEAEAAFARGTSIDTESASPHVGLGKLYMAWGRHNQAQASFEAALQLEPGNPDASGGLGQLRLLLRDWTNGWDLYEARRSTEAAPVRNMPYPEWRGEAGETGTVLIHAEQGLGDIILFANCLPDLVERKIDCIVEVPPRLESLFARSFPDVRIIGHEPNDRDLGWLGDLKDIATHRPIGSLPALLRRSEAQFPQHRGYLRADPAKVTAWKQQLSQQGGRWIGIAWRGGLVGTSREQRSLQLAELVRALQPTGANLVCLQYGDVASDLQFAASSVNQAIHPGLSGYGDLDDAAALTVAVDGVVTVCSTQAHLTGALGRPGLVLVPANPSWRYCDRGEDMPWYPSLRLARQATLGDWSDPLATAQEWVRALGPNTIVPSQERL